jgi:phosphoglycolate phosphatase
MKKYSAVIFDMDGTLLNTLEDLGDCMNRVLTRAGYATHPIDDYRYFVGDGIVNLVRRVLPEQRRDEETIRQIQTAMVEEYGEHWADKTDLYPGISALLDELTKRNIKKGILSNKPHSSTKVIADRYFKDWQFDPVFGARDGVPRKPDPAAALEICRLWGLEPREVLYAGDTNTDMQTARQGGMFTVGVLWGFRSKEELIENGAQELAAEPQEMLSFFRDGRQPV